MSNYFISIGGSGAKTMEALVHLAAAGLMPNDGDLYTLAIDPDVGNGNLNRSCGVMKKYISFQQLHTGATELFKTKMELADPWRPTQDAKQTLDKLMDYQLYKDTPVASLYKALYTEKERQTDLDKGFRGHPSIGSAVMAKSIDIEGDSFGEGPWNSFRQHVEAEATRGEQVRIFLAGSVFGGTGAAGMPTIAKLLQKMFETDHDEGKVMIGGVLVLPYFSFDPKPDDIRPGEMYASSKNFPTNAQAALRYYSMENKGGALYDTMYFVGDTHQTAVRKFSLGSADQKNDAHIVDLYAALAALDFYGTEKKNLRKYAYILHEEDRFTWPDIPVNEEKFAQYIRFILAYLHIVKPVLDLVPEGKASDWKYPWFRDFHLENANCNTVPEVRDFNDYAEGFVTWLLQIGMQPARRVDLIQPQVMGYDEYGNIAVNPDRFVNFDGTDSNVSIDEIWWRISEGCGYDADAGGFGAFLRSLYDACAKEGK